MCGMQKNVKKEHKNIEKQEHGNKKGNVKIWKNELEVRNQNKNNKPKI